MATETGDQSDMGDADTVRTDGVPDASRKSRFSLGTLLQRAVGGVTVLVVLGVVLAPRMSVNAYDATAAAVGLILVVAGWLALAPLVPILRMVPDRWWEAVAGVLCALLTAVTAVFAYFGAYRTGWDAAMIKYTVVSPPDDRIVTAYSAYPNLRPFVAVARTVYGWTTGRGLDYEAAFAVFNTVSFLLTAVAAYLTVRLVAGPARGVLALLLLGALLASSTWLSVAYTDMAALWAPVAAVALLTAAFGRGARTVTAALLAAGGGTVLAVGYLLKTTPVVGLPALLAALAVLGVTQVRSRLRLLTIGTCAAASFLVAVPVLGLWVDATEDLPPLRENTAATPLTFVAAGMRSQTWTGGSTAYGAWDREIIRLTKGRDTVTQDAVARQLIREEWERRGLVGTAGFAIDKTLFNWGDGTFWARGEGADATNPPLRRGPWAEAVLAWTAPQGDLFGLHVLLAQVAWTAVLLALGVGLLRARYRPEVLLLALTVVGIAAFTLVFQGRSRYLMGHVPVVVALAACVIPLSRLPRRNVGAAPAAAEALPARAPAGAEAGTRAV